MIELTKLQLFTIIWCCLIAMLIVERGIVDHPRLVGTGCDGATGPLYANEEDHFPRCDAIERAS